MVSKTARNAFLGDSSPRQDLVSDRCRRGFNDKPRYLFSGASKVIGEARRGCLHAGELGVTTSEFRMMGHTFGQIGLHSQFKMAIRGLCYLILLDFLYPLSIDHIVGKSLGMKRGEVSSVDKHNFSTLNSHQNCHLESWHHESNSVSR